MSMIGAFFKYASMILVVLVLSHIIQIQGITISQYVEIGMNWINPSANIEKITRTVSKQIETRNKAVNQAIREDSEVTPNDQRALNQVIEGSQKR